MADIQEAIRRLIYQYVVEGADKVKASQDAITASTTTTEKAALSLEKSFDNLERRYVSTVRQQQDYQQAQEKVNAAVGQNPALQERANVVLAALSEKYNQATVAQKAFATATSGVQGQLLALSAGAGPVGTFLSSLGPWGIAAAAGLGAIEAVFDKMNEGAKRIGDKSIELKKFSDVTGLSVTEIKGLTKAGAELGVSSDDITTSLEHFSVGLNEARRGSGTLFDQVLKINPALAQQLAQAKNTAEGWDVLAQAIKAATDAAQRNALARAAFARGGIETGLVAAASVDKGGVAAMGADIEKNTGLTKEWVSETARLRKENEELEKSIKNMTDAAYALPMLQRQNEFLKTQKEIAEFFIKLPTDFYGAGFNIGAEAPMMPTPDKTGSAGSGPLSEGAMQAQQEAAAQRETVKALEEANKARDYAVSVEKMLVTIAQDTAEAEKRKAAVFAQNAAAYQNVSATTAQTLAQLKDQLNVASAVGGAAQIEAQHRATINDLMRQGKSLTDATAIADEQRNIALAKIEAAHQATMVHLQGQLSVAQQITGIGQINAQYEANIVNLKLQGLNTSQAIAQADMQRSIALAQVNTQAEQMLKNLQQEGELIRASTQEEKERIKARQTYQDLIDKGVESSTAGAIAAQMQANARATADATDTTKSWSVANDEAAAASRRLEPALASVSDGFATYAAHMREANRATTEFMNALPLTRMAMSLMNPYVEGKSAWNNFTTQFNPAGYTSATTDTSNRTFQLTSQYGPGGFDPQTGMPNAQGLAYQYKGTSSAAAILGGGLTSTSYTSGLGGFPTPQTQLDPNKVSIAQRAIELLPKEQQLGPLQQMLEMAKGAPASLEQAELVKQLTDNISQLTDATKDNTSATSAMTDVLSPFYSSDPRNTHLGFRAFAGGGIMSQYGELPIRHYQGGGMATSPQVAVFGEGSTPEAYVPVPSGRIPVELKTPANSNQRPVNVTINVMGNADQSTVTALRSTAFQQAQTMRRMMA